MKRNKTAVLAFLFLLFSLLPAAHCGAGFPTVERIVLPNKLVLLVFQDHSIPAVTLELLVGAGSWLDPPNAKGLANLTNRSLLLGSRYFSYDEINSRLDFIGANLDVDCRKDLATLSMQMLKKDLDNGLGLFVDLLVGPTFPQSDVTREKEDILGKLRSQEDDPLEVANRAFEKALFMNSPYASPVEGSETSLREIGTDDLARFYSSYYRPNNAILVIGGDITPAEVQSRIVPRLLQWQPAEIPAMHFQPEFAEGATTVKIDKPVSQASIIIGGPAVERADKDYYAFAVMSQILGSGNLSSRLMAEIRVNKGLAYSVESFLFARKHAGSFKVVLQTKDSSAKEAIDLALKEMDRMKREPVSESELENAKNFLIGNFPISHGGTQQNYAKFISLVEYYGLGSDYPDKYPSLINAVTGQDILRVAGKYLKPENVIVIVGDLKQARFQ